MVSARSSGDPLRIVGRKSKASIDLGCWSDSVSRRSRGLLEFTVSKGLAGKEQDSHFTPMSGGFLARLRGNAGRTNGDMYGANMIVGVIFVAQVESLLEHSRGFLLPATRRCPNYLTTRVVAIRSGRRASATYARTCLLSLVFFA